MAPEARSSEFLQSDVLGEASMRPLTELRYHEYANEFFDPFAWGPEDVREAWYEEEGGKGRRDVKLKVQQLLRSHEAVYASDGLFAGEEAEVIRVEDYAGDFLNAMYKPEDILRAWHGKATQPWRADAGVDVTQAAVDLVRRGMLVNVPDNPIEPQVWSCHNFIAGQGPGFCRGVHHFVEYRLHTGWCGGCHCCKRPVLQRDRPKLVVDYAALKKHYALLHEQVPSDCSVFGGADCVHELSHWAGAGNCAVQAATRGTCREYCSKHGRRCVKAMDNGGGRCHGGGGLKCRPAPKGSWRFGEPIAFSSMAM